MRVPQIAEEVRLAPVRALRVVFAGIGQVLLATERFATEHAEQSVTAAPAGSVRSADNEVNAGPDAARGRAAGLDHGPRRAGRADMGGKAKKGKAKDAKAKDAKAKDLKAKGAKAKDLKAKGAKAKDLKVKDAKVKGAKARAVVVPDRLPPVPGYDELSLPSVRARLRTFDVPKLRELADYERSHADRPDFVQMFERRIVRVEAGQA